MTFWDTATLPLADFRPGIMSQAEMGDHLTMVCMEIAPHLEDTGHKHAFDQCGIILEGQLEMSIGTERRTLGPGQAFFIPAGEHHRWKTLQSPVKALDVTPKQTG